METQITIKLTKEEKEIIEKASGLLGVGHSTFLKMIGLERARELNLKLDSAH